MMPRPAPRRRPRPPWAALSALSAILLGAAGPGLADCTRLGGKVVCDGRAAHAEVGRTLFFPQGPAATRSGHYLRRTPEGLPEVLPRDGARTERPGGAPPGGRGREYDFGAFEFPTGARLRSLRRE
jgi:hypothetical protein